MLSSDIWSSLLGVDVRAADGFLRDESAVREWLERFSAGFLSYIIWGQADSLLQPKESRPLLIDRIIMRHLRPFPLDTENLVRRMYLIHLFFTGKRRTALQLADAVMYENKDFAIKNTGLNEQEQRLILALKLTETDPSNLLLYFLLDRAERVRFQSSLLQTKDIPSDPSIQVNDALKQMQDTDISRVLAVFYGAQDRARLVGRVPLKGIKLSSGEVFEDTYILFVLRRGQSESIQTYDGLLNIVRGEWIILKYINGGNELAVHGGNEGFRLGERIAGEATNRLIVYDHGI